MPFSHDTGGYNVTSTIKNWLYQQIVANQPPLVSTVVVKADWPEEGITSYLPCWSIVWMGDVPAMTPNRSGDARTGLVDVSCWVTRRNGSWMAQVEQMQDAVMKAVATLRTTGSAIVIQNFYASSTAPTATSARLIVDRAERRMPPADPNPDIERRRVVLYITWFET